MSEYQLGIIGAGNMAEAIVRGVLAGKILSKDAIVASDASVERQGHISKTFGVKCTGDNALPARCDKILLAVKPQQMKAVLDEIAGVVQQDALVISAVAGIPTQFIDKSLKGRGRIIRVMPNTPMLVGEGVSAIASGPRAGQKDLAWAEKLFVASGKAVIVDEKMMDIVTAVSGSGPAYFFYLIEAMVQAGIAEGLDEKTALMLATQTCAGAAKLLTETGLTPQTLRAKVTSPGGTTQQAIELLEKQRVKEIFTQAVRAAVTKSRQLGMEFSK